jgi:cell division protein FtsN
VPTKTVRYRGYGIDIYAPTRPGEPWRVIIWSPNNAVSIPMPNHPSEDAAVKEARAAIDHILDGGPAPKF